MVDFPSKSPHGLWREAVKIRQEWLEHGLSTQPADRRTTEHCLTAIYARMSRPRPRFAWVDSPEQAISLAGGLPTLDQLYAWTRDPRPRGTPPLASDLAMVSSQLRGALSAGVAHLDPELSPARKGKHNESWPQLPPLKAFEAGVPVGVVLHQGIRTALHRSLAHGFRVPVRSTLAGSGPVPACWYGQQDAAWVAYYDALHRLGLAHYGPDELDHLGHWAALARSCGWWWPGEDVCVVVERPEMVHTEPVPGTWHEEVRLQRGGVRYRDGWHPLMA
ncbi:hypothetical protein SAMN04489712_12539 [Thermomonospora echinospora]|uniref:DUF6745 domain-containing protein n=1 Tax=Thermomonospora echinospora TaxID=1992 RepID=A0A1H6DZ57_9ACTN|nr:hypothetical protein [Thermomonospora echinospora]SEG90103.1 hypothetical protein SAMN04489712_12539 [Thermomonospora echinospora]